MVLLVEVVGRENFGNLNEKIKEALLKALRFLGKDNCLVEVCLLNDKEMALINKKTRNQEGPTSVLSFVEPSEIPQINSEPRSLGEIYLAPATIKKRKMDSVKLAVHGLLHLLGYTHEGINDTIKMEQIEDKIWQILLQD